MRFLHFIAIACLLAASSSRADDRLFLAGGEYSDTAYYAYSGVVLPGPGGREHGRGFSQRYWADWLGYQYEGAPGTVKADAYGLEASLAYGTSSESGWADVSVGPRFTNTHLSPADPTAAVQGKQWGLKVQVEGEHDVAATWRAGGIAAYTFGQDGYWVRGRLMHRLGPDTSLGGEAIVNGNPEANSTAVGLVLGFQPKSDHWSVSVKAGYRFQTDADGAYGGLEFGYGF